MDTQKATLVFDRDYQIGEVDKRLYSALIEHVGRQIYHHGIFDPGSPLSDEKGFRTDVLEKTRELGVSMIRYPGGNVVSGFRWEDSVGPVAQRRRNLEPAWFAIEPNTFGLNEFAEWSQKANTDIMYTVNMGTRGMEDAKNVVEYCNIKGGTYWSDLRRSHGYEQPHHIKLWCVGNETDGPWQIGMKTGNEYGRLCCETSKLMKWVDPSIELVAHGSSSAQMGTYPNYIQDVLEHAYDQVDYIALHQYYGNEKENDPANYLAKMLELEDYIHTTIAACDYVKAKKRSKKVMNISFDEYNACNFIEPNEIADPNLRWLEGGKSRFEEKASLEDALLVGSMLITFLKHADRIKIACIASLINATGTIMIDENGSYRQTYYFPLQHVAHYGKGTVIIPAVYSEKYDSRDFTDVPMVDSVAVHNQEEDELTIFAVNRSLEDTITTECALRGLDQMELVEHIVMNDSDRKARNTFASPNRVTPYCLEKADTLDRQTLTTALPPFSWNVIRLKKMK